MAKFINRADVIPDNNQANTTRNYLAKYIEATSGLLLQNAINALFVNSPALMANKTGVHLVSTDYVVTGTGANTRYTALLIFYFLEFEPTTVIP